MTIRQRIFRPIDVCDGFGQRCTALLACLAVGACGSSSSGLYDSTGLSGERGGGAPSDADGAVFVGAGTSGAARPLHAGAGPETAGDCSPRLETPEPSSRTPLETLCFFGADDPTTPAATIEQVVEVVGTAEFLHVRLTLNPTFVDNSFGDSAIGWGEPRGVESGEGGKRQRKKARTHDFKDLVGSDHAELKLLDADGDVVMHFRLDFLSEDPDAPSGYRSLGIDAGDGKLIEGNAEWLLASTTSLDRNLNACGLDDFVESSPETDESYSVSVAAPEWDYRVSYEAWISVEAFGDDGFGQALIDSVHASPSKTGDNSEDVVPGPCPPGDGDEPLNDDGISLEPPPYEAPTIR